MNRYNGSVGWLRVRHKASAKASPCLPSRNRKNFSKILDIPLRLRYNGNMKKRYSNSNEVYWGKEPNPKSFPHPLDPKFNNFLIEAFNWYNYSATSEKKKEWFIKWVQENRPKASIEAIRQITDGAFTTAGAVARLYSLGLTDSDYLNGKLDKWVSEFVNEGLEKIKVKESQSDAKKKQISSDPRLTSLIESIDRVVDDFIKSGYRKTEFDMNDWLRLNSPSPAHHAAIKDRYFPIVEELLNEEADEQLTEAYSHLSDKQVERFIELLLDIVTTKKVRKARTVKKTRSKSPEKMTKNVRFASSDSDTGVKSVEPKSIPGSSAVAVWNKKYRMLGLYVAVDGKELAVKGSTILNFDEDLSISKKIRKPNEHVAKSVSLTKAQFKKNLDGVTSKPCKMNGRLNNETVILKVY